MPEIIIQNPAITNANPKQALGAATKPCWKTELATAFSRPSDLLEFLSLPPERRPRHWEPVREFPLRVTAAFARRIKKGDPDDPLLRQVLPLAEEQAHWAGHTADPVGDLGAVAVPGLLHKYHGRALLIATGTCAIHCRYCFRREFPYAESQLTRSRYAEAIAYLARDASIAEVILSGGDPLLLDDGRLADLMTDIAAIPHVIRLRIHSRLPIVLPSRITPDFTRVIVGTRLKPVMVIHANHANELDAEVGHALQGLRRAGVVLLNQSVLLKGVNDTLAALTDLSESLFNHGVLPYYLHLLDKAKGTGHFDLPEPTALALHQAMRRHLPGYLVPKLVREVAGAAYKLSPTGGCD